MIIIRRREIKDLDAVVALIERETTLETLVHRNGKCKLRSENLKCKNSPLTDQSTIQAVMTDKL